MIITIDGTPAAGKTTMAKMFSAKYALTHLGSGAMFRTIVYYCVSNGINLCDEKEVAKQLHHIHITLKQDNVILNGKDVSEIIRTPEITNKVCLISHIPAIRSFVKNFQQTASKKGDVICDGRKVGVEVFPQAEKKFFLDAELTIRASRRYLEYLETDPTIKYCDVLDDLKRRENTEIKNGILMVPEHAIKIDTTHLLPEEVFVVMENYLEEYLQ